MSAATGQVRRRTLPCRTRSPRGSATIVVDAAGAGGVLAGMVGVEGDDYGLGWGDEGGEGQGGD